jgi:hypothetical protein
MVKKPINSKIINSEINQRIERRYNPAINKDGSIDCRKKIKPVDERVRVVKPVSRQADGQYTRETAYQPKFRLVIYPYDPVRIYRRDIKTGFEVAIVERINGEWFPCCILRPSEIQALRSFPGAAGMDIDKAISTKDRCKVTVEKSITKNIDGRSHHRGTSNLSQEERKQVKKQVKKDAKKQRSLLLSVDVRKNPGNTRRVK